MQSAAHQGWREGAGRPPKTNLTSSTRWSPLTPCSLPLALLNGGICPTHFKLTRALPSPCTATGTAARGLCESTVLFSLSSPLTTTISKFPPCLADTLHPVHFLPLVETPLQALYSFGPPHGPNASCHTAQHTPLQPHQRAHPLL
eukprot:GGOE01006936.1.p2 GENE.GGOE01006936.1~~GGOE01006936.1.p2  ORF type:complete len:145 (-),score=7.95 GGOE01006936.1:948-1382(-)